MIPVTSTAAHRGMSPLATSAPTSIRAEALHSRAPSSTSRTRNRPLSQIRVRRIRASCHRLLTSTGPDGGVVAVKGQIVHSPAGEEVVLDEVGQTVLLDNSVVRVWD